MATGNATTVEVNGVRYRWPEKPVVVVCIDGGYPAYLRQFLADGAIPNIARFMRQGFATIADGTVPSFTCPNNIDHHRRLRRHGISGNYIRHRDREAVR
jgi:phosphonoacetate hydrolase